MQFFCPYNRRVGSQLLLSATTLHPSGGYQHWRQLHAQSYGGTHIWISMQYTTHFQAPHTTKRHRRTDKHSRCLNGSCSAVAGYVETSKSSRWLTMPSHGEMGSQPRSPEVTVALTDNQAHLITTAITTLPLKGRRGLDMARNPLPGTPINLPVVRTGPETHPPRTAVSAPRGPLYRARRSTWRREQAWARAVQTAWTVDEASDRDIDSAEFSALWPSTSEDEADRRSPRPQHSAASGSQQVALQATAGAHSAAEGLRSPSPGWAEANDILPEAWDGTNLHHAPDDARLPDEGLRSPHPAPDGTDSSRKRGRHVAKMLVRSGLRCHCCFKLKHECERRKAAALLASCKTSSCKCPLSL